MTWAPSVITQEEIEGFVEDLMAVTPEVLGIDETLPGCEVINMDPYGVGVGTLPRYIKVAIREYYQDVFYRGGLTGLSVGDYVTVTHLREGNRYEVTGAGGGSGTTPSPPPDPTLQGQALVSNAVPEWVASLTPTWLGTHTWGSGFALMPTDATGQDLGDATHRWDLHTQAVLFEGATGSNIITVPDNVADALHISDAGGLEYLRIVSTNLNPYVLIDPAGAGINVGIGVIPNQKLTVEGTIDLKEQAAANADAAAYGQIWVKNTTPNELWFTDDAGTDVQLGLGAGGLPAVAGAGYALISDGVNSWVADQTPTWTGEHSFVAGIAFTGASGANEITVPDNIAIALEILDVGGLEYLRVVSTDANPYVLIGPGAVGIKVGIGLPIPTELLHVYEGGNAHANIVVEATQNTYAARIAFDVETGAMSRLGVYDDGYAGVTEYAGKMVQEAYERSIMLVAWGATAADQIQFYTGGRAAANKRVVIDKDGKVGFETATIPHGGIGYAKFAIEGANASSAGPHVQYTTATDDYPLFQQLNYAHDNIILNFDCYYDGVSKSSDAGSNARIQKGGDKLSFQCDSGIAQGAAVTWNNGIVLDLVTGNVGIGTTGPQGLLHGYDSFGGFIYWEGTVTGGGTTTIIPNGAGDVVYGVYFQCLSTDRAGTVYQQNAYIDTPGAGSLSFKIFDDAAGVVVDLRLHSTGLLELHESSGAATVYVNIIGIWQ